MKTINRVTLMGNLAADPELKKTTEGHSLANMAIATDRNWATKDGDKKTDFHRVIAWNKLAEICEKYLKKGNAVYVEGSLLNRSYTDQKGEKKYIVEIVANEINFLDGKKEE